MNFDQQIDIKFVLLHIFSETLDNEQSVEQRLNTFKKRQVDLISSIQNRNLMEDAKFIHLFNRAIEVLTTK